MRTNKLHKMGGWALPLLTLFFATSAAFSQTAKFISLKGDAWAQKSTGENIKDPETGKNYDNNQTYIPTDTVSEYKTTKFNYSNVADAKKAGIPADYFGSGDITVKSRLAYLSDDPFGSRKIRSILRTTFAEGSAVIESGEYFRRTCLSVSYDKDWLLWSSDEAKSKAISTNSTYPAIIYAYSVANGDLYDVYFYVSDDSKPLAAGDCQHLFDSSPGIYCGRYEDMSGLEWWDFSEATSLTNMFRYCRYLKEITLSGEFSSVQQMKEMFAYCRALTKIKIDGEFSNKLKNMEGMLRGCISLTDVTIPSTEADAAIYLKGDFTGVETINNLFVDCTSLTNGTIDGDFRGLKSEQSVFNGCTALETATIKGNFSSLTNINSIFNNCNALKDATLDGDFSSLVNMSSLFNGRKALESATIKGDFRSVENLTSVFENCTNLGAVDLDADFKSAKSMNKMFKNCSTLTEVEVKGDFGNVTTTEDMFNGCTTLTAATLDGEFENITNLKSMFNSCKALESVALAGNFSKVTTTESMFKDCSTLTSALFGGDFEAITSMKDMFRNCTSLSSASLTGDFRNVTTTESMFYGDSVLTSATIDGNFGSALTKMSNMLQNCTAIKSFSINGGEADVKLKGTFENVTTITDMVKGCSALEKIKIISDMPKLTTFASLFNGLKKLETATIQGDFSNIATTNSMFRNCENLTNAVLNCNFSSKLTNMQYMFGACSALESVSFSKDGDESDIAVKGDFSGVTTMQDLFNGCTQLKKVSLKDDFSSLTNIGSLFSNCNALEDVSFDGKFSSLTSIANLLKDKTNLKTATFNGDFSKVTSMQSLFENCEKLKKALIKGVFNSLTNMSYMFKKCTTLESLAVNDTNADAIVVGDFSEVMQMKQFVNNCTSLKKTIIKGNFRSLNDIYNNTSSKNCEIFSNCTNLQEVMIDGKFTTLESLNLLFKGLKNLKIVSVQGEYPSLSQANAMFEDCDALTSATFNGFTNALADMRWMFKSNNKYKTEATDSLNIVLSGDFSGVSTTQEMFNGTANISNIALVTPDDTLARFTNLTNAKDMFSYWQDRDFATFKSILENIALDTIKMPGGVSDNNAYVNSKYNTSPYKSDKFTNTRNLVTKNSKKLHTGNMLVYDVINGHLVYNSEATLLPIELSYFSITQNDESIVFEWETATETNNDYFTIEQCIDGVSFTEVLRINGAGTTSSSNYYEHTLPVSFTGMAYFRLKQTDYNGDYSYSDVQTIFIGNSKYILLYPTIATDFITIEGDYESVKFSDAQGKIHHPTRMHGNSYPIAALPRGIHYAIISLKNGEIVTRQFFRK